ncbi:MAG: YigZ family protein [Candidatus Zixiibacteriota bacterium]
MSNLIENGFRTIGKNGQDEFTEKKSRFLGFIRFVQDVEGFERFLDEIKAEFPDATHHVWAYRLLENGHLRELYSDDGEPSQSSGPPCLRVIAGRDLINTAAIVVRYYGGTKLGVGGLIRAYSHATKLALENAKIVKKVPADIWQIDIDYTLLGQIENFLEKYRGNTIARNFSDTVELQIVLTAKYREIFERLLNDLTRGKGKFKIEGEKYVIWS